MQDSVEQTAQRIEGGETQVSHGQMTESFARQQDKQRATQERLNRERSLTVFIEGWAGPRKALVPTRSHQMIIGAANQQRLRAPMGLLPVPLLVC